jgi:hypothetical protein
VKPPARPAPVASGVYARRETTSRLRLDIDASGAVDADAVRAAPRMFRNAGEQTNYASASRAL